MRIFKVITITLTVLLLAAVGLFVTVPLVNNTTADRLETKLKNTPLPRDTVFCDSISVAGKIIGNGNGMQYFGAILIRSDLSADDLEEHYARYRAGQWDFLVAGQAQEIIDMLKYKSHGFPYLDNVESLDGYYIVCTWGSSKYPLRDLDLRGH